MANTASITFRLFGVDVSARRTIDAVGLSALTSAKSLEASAKAGAKWAAIITGAGAASLAAGGAIGVGLVGAVAGVGIAFAAQAENVKKTWGGLGTYLKDQSVALTKPIQNVLINLAGETRKTFDSLKPTIGGLFAAVAPLVQTLGSGLLNAVATLTRGLGGLLQMAKPLAEVFAKQLAPFTQNLVLALKNILGPASQNSAAFGQLFATLGQLLPILGEVIGSFLRLGAQVMPVLGPVLLQVAHILSEGLAQVLPIIARAIVALLPSLTVLFSALVQGVAAVAPALPGLARAFASLVSAVAPLIPQIVSHLLPGIIALVPPLGQLLSSLVPLIPPILKILEAFWPLGPLILKTAVAIVQSLMPALTPFLTVVGQLVSKFAGALMVAIVQSAPSLVTLAKNFGQILTAVTPLLPVLVNLMIAFTPLIPLWTKLAATASKILVPAIQGIAVVAAVAAHGVAVAFKLMADVVLSAVIGMLGAASHLPFVGGKFGEAQRAVKDFKTSVDSDLENVISSTNRAQSEAIRNIGKIAPGIEGQKPKIQTAAQRISSSVNAALGAIGRKVDIDVTAHLQSILGKMSSPQLRGQTGMLVPGSGSGDIVPALLEPGEAVVPRRLVPAVAPFLSQHGVPGFAAGGVVAPWVYNWQGHPPSTDTIASDIARQAAGNLGGLLGGLGVGGGLGSAVGVQRWAPVFLAALGLAGQSSSWLGLGLRRLAQESGGNQFAINLWDSNAARGDPSRGLMQTIGSTFNAYADGLRGRGIYDPLANIFAAIRYTLARYGSLAAWGRPGGYASGLDYVPFDNFPALLHRGERVVPASGNGGGDIHVHIYGTVLTTRTVARDLRDALNLDSRNNGGRTGIGSTIGLGRSV